MRLESEFAVDAPLMAVYGLVADLGRAALCAPGTELVSASGDAADLGLRVRIGPVTKQYRARVEVVERDPASHRVVMRVSARPTIGFGLTEGTVELRLRDVGGVTTALFTAELTVSPDNGAPVASDVIDDEVTKLAGRFARNLARALYRADPAAATDRQADPAAPRCAAPDRAAVARTRTARAVGFGLAVAGAAGVVAARRAARS